MTSPHLLLPLSKVVRPRGLDSESRQLYLWKRPIFRHRECVSTIAAEKARERLGKKGIRRCTYSGYDAYSELTTSPKVGPYLVAILINTKALSLSMAAKQRRECVELERASENDATDRGQGDLRLKDLQNAGMARDGVKIWLISQQPVRPRISDLTSPDIRTRGPFASPDLRKPHPLYDHHLARPL
ncbi:hypothetical protein BDZ89DRAFT_21865 [Hymenopellis radicata]|nr:hypothetical protein BDZ89DRAFT_21865 [Hymenopellis radicata]